MAEFSPDFISNKWVTGELAVGYDTAAPTITVGHAIVNAVTFNGSGISTNLANAVDITSPSAWTDLVDVSGGPGTLYITSPGGNEPIYIEVDTAEDADDAVRCQIIIDSVTVWDVTCTRNAGNNIDARLYGPVVANQDASAENTIKLNFSSTIKIRACREGTFADSGSYFKTGDMHYNLYQ